MANIPGIIGFVAPGAYSLVDIRPGPVSLPGGPTVIALLGRGRREEFLVRTAVGGGADGEPENFDPALAPDGRHYQVLSFPVVPGSIEVFINPAGDGLDLPLIQVTEQDMADAWIDEFDDLDGYTGFAGFGAPGDSVDAYQNTSDGSGFFDSKWARQYADLQDQLGITAGSPEPNHYIFEATTGRLILDQALGAFDTLLVSYIGESDINSPERFLDINDLFQKHGFPSKENSIALAAQIANENGANVFVAVHAGEILLGEGSARRLVQEPTLSTALTALEKEDEVSILVPIVSSRVNNEIIMSFYEASVHGSLTDGGSFLQEDPATGDQPGINISPLAVIPLGQPGAGDPAFLEVYKNGRLLQYNIDYSVPNLDGSSLNGTTNVLIAFSPTYPGATHSVDNTLIEGERVTANYLPAQEVINLVATGQLACLNHAEIMSQTRNRQERICLFGSYEFVDLDFILDPITGIEANFGISKRAQFFWPGGTSVTRVVGGEIQTLDGQYISAAASGFYAIQPIPFTLTNKTLQGFTINPSQKLSIDKTNFAGGAGVSMVAPLAAGGRVVVGQTTTNSGRAVEEEMSVVRISDFTAKTMRARLQSTFTGVLITPNLTTDIETAVKSILSQLQSQGLITSSKNVQVRVDDNEPRQVNVSFDITPTFPLNWIFIRFSVGV